MKSKRYYYCPNKSCSSIYQDRSNHPDHSEDLERIPSELTEEFGFTKKLGSGANGVVFQIFDEDDELNKALKLLNVVKKDEMKMELKVLIRLHHQYIVRYFMSGIVKKKAYIVMEACDMNLNEYMTNNNEKLTYEDKTRLFLQICQGIDFFHNHPQGEIVHRDLKLSNILMVGQDIRISDFGESKIMESQSKSTGIRGTMSYFPPEVLSLDDDAKMIVSLKHDIWSLGIIAHQMFADGQHPFKIPNSDTLWKKNVMDGNYRIDYKLIAKGSPIDLAIQGCLVYNPKKRLNIKEILDLFFSVKIPTNPTLNIPIGPPQRLPSNLNIPIRPPQRLPSTREETKIDNIDDKSIKSYSRRPPSSSSRPPLPVYPSPPTTIPHGDIINFLELPRAFFEPETEGKKGRKSVEKGDMNSQQWSKEKHSKAEKKKSCRQIEEEEERKIRLELEQHLEAERETRMQFNKEKQIRADEERKAELRRLQIKEEEERKVQLELEQQLEAEREAKMQLDKERQRLAEKERKAELRRLQIKQEEKAEFRRLQIKQEEERKAELRRLQIKQEEERKVQLELEQLLEAVSETTMQLDKEKQIRAEEERKIELARLQIKEEKERKFQLELEQNIQAEREKKSNEKQRLEKEKIAKLTTLKPIINENKRKAQLQKEIAEEEGKRNEEKEVKRNEEEAKRTDLKNEEKRRLFPQKYSLISLIEGKSFVNNNPFDDVPEYLQSFVSRDFQIYSFSDQRNRNKKPNLIYHHSKNN